MAKYKLNQQPEIHILKKHIRRKLSQLKKCQQQIHFSKDQRQLKYANEESTARLPDIEGLRKSIHNTYGANVEKTFEAIIQNPLFTMQQIADDLKKTPRTIKNHITKLQEAHIIVRRGPKHKSYWEIIV